MLEVTLALSPGFLDNAIAIGTARYENALKKDYANYGNVEGAQLKFNVMGAVAECGVAEFFRQKWNDDHGNLKLIDVGKIIEVRGRPPHHDLGIRPAHKDKRQLPHVLVWVHDDYQMDLKGWLFGYEGMHEKGSDLDRRRWNVNSKCWYNPPPYRPLEELQRILADDDEVGRILQRHLAERQHEPV